MNLIKRFTTSVTATLDNAVTQLENHDAIIEATLKEMRHLVAKTSARINTLHQQLSLYESQFTHASEQIALWEARASALIDSDQDKALQCLARRNEYDLEKQRLSDSIDQQQNLIRKVEDNQQTLKSKLEEMQLKHADMRSRQSVAEAARVTDGVSNRQNVQDTFERWESLVLEHELNSDALLQLNSQECELEREFNEQEAQSRLREQLVELKKAKEVKDYE